METKRLIEIRSYKLITGSGASFHQAVVSEAIPLLRSRGADLVAFGPSAHEPDTYYLVRAYEDLAELQAWQEAFYGSSAWRDGPRARIVKLIVSYLNTVLWLSPEGVEDMRRLNDGAAARPCTDDRE